MKSITVENYRCFGTEETARLAPLTLLVGENSTGEDVVGGDDPRCLGCLVLESDP